MLGAILKKILRKNKEEFTKESNDSVACLAVLEEAQSVLGQFITHKYVHCHLGGLNPDFYEPII